MKAIIFCIVSLFVYKSWGQEQENDTLYYAVGKITNSVTKEPVQACIRYNSLPYGAITGTLNGPRFRFPFFDTVRYEVTISAFGFKEVKAILDPTKANLNRHVIWNVELTPDSPIVNVGNSSRLNNLIFEPGTAKIDSASFPELDNMAQMLKNNPKMTIRLEGHTDPIGNSEKNMQLSRQRVDAVKNYLLGKGGVKHQVQTKSFGGTQPLSREDDEGRINRRVEVRVLRQ